MDDSDLIYDGTEDSYSPDGTEVNDDDEDIDNLDPMDFEEQGYLSSSSRSNSSNVGNDQDIDLQVTQRDKILTNLFKYLAKDMMKTRKKTPKYPGMAKLLEEIKQEQDDQEDEIDEDDFKPWEFKYDEEYDPTSDKLMKFEKSREYMAKKMKSNSRIMQEITKEWEENTHLVKLFIMGILKKETLPNKLSSDQIKQIFASCDAAFHDTLYGRSIFTEVEKLGWIDRWRLSTLRGGKGLVVRGKQFSGTTGIFKYRDLLSSAIQQNTDSSLVAPEEILPTSEISVKLLLDSYQENIVENTIFKQVGQVILKPSISTLEDLTLMIDRVRLEEDNKSKYDIEKLTNKLQNKMKIKFTPKEERIFKDNVSSIAKRNDSVFLKDLFYTKDNKPLIQRKPTLDDDIEKLSVFMESISLKDDEAIVADNPFSIGFNKGDKLITTKYSDKVQFIRPYSDPHFTFLNEVVETWVPTVHYVTGLPVFTQKEEVLRYSLQGRLVYIKLQRVPVNVNGRTLNIYYFRKFVNFLDYLKSWQETYVENVVRINVKLEKYTKVTAKRDLDSIALLLDRRNLFIKKIGDIKKYFISQMEKNIEPDKMEIYLSDQVVERIINPSDNIEGSILNIIDRLKSDIISQFNSIKIKNSTDFDYLYGKLNDIIKLKRIINFYTRFFPDQEFIDIRKNLDKEKNICNQLISILIPEYNTLDTRAQKIEHFRNQISTLRLDYRTFCDGQQNIDQLKKEISNISHNIEVLKKDVNSFKTKYYKVIPLIEKIIPSGYPKEAGVSKEITRIMNIINTTNSSIIDTLNTLVKNFTEIEKHIFDNKLDGCIKQLLLLETDLIQIIDSLEDQESIIEIYNKWCKIIKCPKYYIKMMNNDIDFMKLYGKQIVNIMCNLLNATMKKYSELYQKNDELGKYIQNPMNHMDVILQLIKIRYTIKSDAKKIYDSFQKMRTISFLFYELTLDQKLKNARESIVSENIGNNSEIERLYNIAKKRIEDDHKQKSGRSQTQQEVQQMHISFMKGCQIKDFNDYFKKCTSDELELYKYFLSLSNEFKMRSKLLDRGDQLYSFDNRNPLKKQYQKLPEKMNVQGREKKRISQKIDLYQNILTYLSGCIEMSKKR